MCYVQAWKYPVSGYMYSNCDSNSTDLKPTTMCVEVCTDDALLHGVGLVQSELVFLALCCGGDYNQVSSVFIGQTRMLQLTLLYRRACQAVGQRSHLSSPGTHLVSHW
jgi:hypothetical protein